MAHEPVINVMSGRVPGVEVFFASFPSGTVSVTVWRLSGGLSMKVRGAADAATAGQLTRIDFEVPFGVEVTYRAECFNAVGQRIGYTGQASTLLDIPGMWVHNPLDPQGAVQCEFLDRATRSISAPNGGSLARIPGQRVGVFLAGTQQGITDVDLSIAVDSIEDRDRVLTMLGRTDKHLPPILCFRIGAEHRIALPRPFYAVTPDVALEDLDVIYGGDTSHFIARGDEAAPPAPGLFVPLLTLGDLKAAYATLGDLKADNLTLGDVNRRYDLAGG